MKFHVAFCLLNDFLKVLSWHCSVSTSLSKSLFFWPLIFRRMFHYAEKNEQKGGGLILCSDIKKINLKMQFFHYIKKKK